MKETTDHMVGSTHSLCIMFFVLYTYIPGSILCVYVMFVSPHIIYVHMLSVTNKLKITTSHLKNDGK